MLPISRRRWVSSGFCATVVSAGVGLASVVATAPAATAAAHPAASSATTTSAAASAAGYLARSLTGSHHDHLTASYVSGGKTIVYPAYGETADAVLSMDAAGVAQNGAKRATAYLEAHVTSYVGGTPTDYPGAAAKLLLVADAQHVDPTRFGGVDLVTAITDSEGAGGAPAGQYQQNPGSTGSSYIVSQALPVLALAASADTGAQPDSAAVSALAGQQCANGSFESVVRTDTTTACTTSDVDSTGYAVQALLGAGDHAAAAAGLGWLATHRNHDGGYGDGGSSNANSTALAAQALLMGHRSATSAERWLRSAQVGCGHTTKHQGAVTFADGKYDGSALLATSQAGQALSLRPLAWIDSSGAVTATPSLRCSAS